MRMDPSSTPAQVYTQWQATRTRRWHTNPALSRTEDPVGAHSARMVILALYFDPALSREAIIYIISHDLAEIITGDIPYPVKHDNPEFNAALTIADEDANKQLNIPSPNNLTQTERQLISLVDRLDAWLWMANHYAPSPTTTSNPLSWHRYLPMLMQQAQALSLDAKLSRIIDAHTDIGPLR